MPDTTLFPGDQTSYLGANRQEAPGLGTLLPRPHFLASGQRGRRRWKGRVEGAVAHCSVALWRKADPHHHTARLNKGDRRA